MRAFTISLLPFALGCSYLGLGNDGSASKFEKRLATARTLLASRDCVGAQREAAAAAELLRRADPNDPRIADALAIDGSAALERGAAEAARERFAAGLKILDDRHDATNPGRVRLLHGMGVAQGRLGELAAAEDTLLRATTALDKEQEKPDLARRRDLRRDLAEVYGWMGRGKQAAEALEQALDAERERQGLGGDTAAYAALLCQLGRAKLDAGDLDGAAASFDRANRVHKGLRASPSAENAGGGRATIEESWLAVNTAALVIARGQSLHVEPLFEQALRTLSAEYNGIVTPRHIAVQREFGVALFRRGKLDPSEHALKAALADCQRLYGPKHPELGRTLLAYAEVLDATQRADEAQRCRARAKEIAGALKTFSL